MTATMPSNRAQRWTTIADGQRIRELRRQRGLAQAELAGLAGVSLDTVARLERAAPDGLPDADSGPDRRRARGAARNDRRRHSAGPRDTE